MTDSKPAFWPGRLKAAGVHFAISVAVAALAALLVFGVWYPYPYREISGGRELFLLVVAVDVIMGPLMTLAIFNLSKPRKELFLDLSVIAVLQLAALGYGLWTVSVARPVHLAFEIDRFRVVHAIDVPMEIMDKAPPEFRQLPLTGPTLLSVREFKDAKESFDFTFAAVAGAALGARPDLWQSYETAKPQVLTVAKPLADLKARFPTRSTEIDAALASAKVASTVPVSYVPLAGRDKFWTVLIHSQTTEVLAFVPIDSF